MSSINPADEIKDENGKPWYESGDASLWAKAFATIHPDAVIAPPLPPDDLDDTTEAIMLGWFANAIMRGHDMAMTQEVIPRTSDGYHTFAELYEHRHALFTLLLLHYSPGDADPWFSLLHDDGTMFDGYFIAGMDVKTSDTSWERVTYHLPVSWLPTYMNAARNGRIEKLDTAPPFDGHTAEDVLNRLTQACGWEVLPKASYPSEQFLWGPVEASSC